MGASVVAMKRVPMFTAHAPSARAATRPAPVHDNVKRQILANDERSSVLLFRQFHNTARVARNSVSEQIAEISARPGAVFADVAALASGARGRTKVYGEGDVDGGMWWAGQVQGLIHDIDTVHNVVARIVAEAEELLRHSLPSYLA